MWQWRDKAAAAAARAVVVLTCATLLGSCIAAPAGSSSPRRQLRQASSTFTAYNECPMEIEVTLSFPLDDGGFGDDSVTFGCDSVTTGLNPDSEAPSEGDCVRSFALEAASETDIRYASGAYLYILPSTGKPALSQASYEARADGEGCGPDDVCFTWYTVYTDTGGVTIQCPPSPWGSGGDSLAPSAQPGAVPPAAGSDPAPSLPSPTRPSPSARPSPISGATGSSGASGSPSTFTPAGSSGSPSSASGSSSSGGGGGGGSSVPIGAIVGGVVGGVLVFGGAVLMGVKHNKNKKARGSPKADPFDPDLDVDRALPPAPHELEPKKMKSVVVGAPVTGPPAGGGAIAAAGTDEAVSFTVNGAPAGGGGAVAVAGAHV